MTPTQAIAALRSAKWSETEIAEAVGANQSTINRISRGVDPFWSLGQALIGLAGKKRSKSRVKKSRATA